MKLETKLKQWTPAKWKQEFWKVFAEYIKKRDKNKCFTCGRVTEGYDSHAGHFIPKSVGGLSLYFHEDNVHAQCAYCNIFLSGNQYKYGEKLGKEKVEELRQLQNETKKISVHEYAQLIEDYKKKIDELPSDS